MSAGSKARRIAKMTSLVVGGLVLLVAIALGAVLLALHTDWGRERIRGAAQDQLDARFRGDVSLGRIEGSVLDGVTIHDIAIHHADGRLAVSIGTLYVDYSVRSLLDRHFHAETILAEDVLVQGKLAEDGTLDLAQLLVEEQETQPSGPGWRVSIDEAKLARGTVLIERATAENIYVTDLSLAGSFALRPGTAEAEPSGGSIDAHLASLKARWVSGLPGAPEVDRPDVQPEELLVEASGFFAKQGPRMRIQRARLVAGESLVAITRAVASTETGELDATAFLDVDPATVQRFAPTAAWRGGLRGSLTAVRAGQDAPVVADFDGTLAASPLAIHAEVTPGEVLRASGRLSFDGLDPREVSARAPAGQLSATVQVDVTGTQLAEAEIHASARVRGSLMDYRVQRLELVADLEDQQLVVELDGRTQTGELAGTARVDLRGEQLSVTGRIRGSGLRYQDIRARTVAADVELEDLTGKPRGEIDLDVRDLRWQDRRLGRIRADVEARDQGREIVVQLRTGGRGADYAARLRAVIERQEGEPIVVRIPVARLRTPGPAWQGEAAVRIRDDQMIAVERVRITSSAGSLTASGIIGTDLQRGRLEVDIEALDLGQTLASLPIDAPRITGRVSARAEVQLGRETLEARVRGQDLVLRPADRARLGPVDFELDLDLDRRLLAIDMAARTARAGSLTASARVRAPRQPMRAAAWQRFRREWIESARVELDDVQIARVIAALPAPPEGPMANLRGTVWGHAALGEDARTAEAQLEARGVSWAGSVPPMQAKLELELEERLLAVVAKARERRLGRVDVAAEVRPPRDLLDVAAWKRLQRRQLRMARIEVRQLDLQRVALLMPQPPEDPMEGVLSAEIEIGDAADTARAEIMLRGGRQIPMRRAIDLDVRAEGTADRVAGAVRVGFGPTRDAPALRVATGEINIRAGIGALWENPDLATRAPAEGTLRLDELSLAKLSRALGLDQPLVGSVSGEIDISGMLADPVARVDLRAPGFGVENARFAALELEGRATRSSWDARLVGRQQAGGQVRVVSRGQLARDPTLTATVVADELDIGFLAPILTQLEAPVREVDGIFEARLELSGTPTSPRLAGTARLRDGQATFASTVRRIHDANLVARVSPTQLSIEGNAESGNGSISLDARARLRDFTPSTFRAQLRTRRLPILAGERNVAVDSQASIVGARRDELWRVVVDIEDGQIWLPEELGGGPDLHPTGDLEDVVYVDAAGIAARKAQEALANGRDAPLMRLTVRTSDPVRVRSPEQADARVSANLDITVLPGGSVINGSIVTERGDVTVFGRTYELRRARLSFDGSVPPNPNLDVLLMHRFDTLTLFVELTGTADEPQLELYADPGTYSRSELLGFVLGGEPGQAAGERRSLEEGAASAAGSLIAGQIEGIVKDRIPVDTIKIGTGEDDPATISYVTVGKWLSDDLFIAYKRVFEASTVDENANEIELEYHFLPRWLLEATVGDAGAGAVDVLWVRRF